MNITFGASGIACASSSCGIAIANGEFNQHTALQNSTTTACSGQGGVRPTNAVKMSTRPQLHGCSARHICAVKLLYMSFCHKNVIKPSCNAPDANTQPHLSTIFLLPASCWCQISFAAVHSKTDVNSVIALPIPSQCAPPTHVPPPHAVESPGACSLADVVQPDLLASGCRRGMQVLTAVRFMLCCSVLLPTAAGRCH